MNLEEKMAVGFRVQESKGQKVVIILKLNDGGLQE